MKRSFLLVLVVALAFGVLVPFVSARTVRVTVELDVGDAVPGAGAFELKVYSLRRNEAVVRAFNLLEPQTTIPEIDVPVASEGRDVIVGLLLPESAPEEDGEVAVGRFDRLLWERTAPTWLSPLFVEADDTELTWTLRLPPGGTIEYRPVTADGLMVGFEMISNDASTVIEGFWADGEELDTHPFFRTPPVPPGHPLKARGATVGEPCDIFIRTSLRFESAVRRPGRVARITLDGPPSEGATVNAGDIIVPPVEGPLGTIEIDVALSPFRDTPDLGVFIHPGGLTYVPVDRGGLWVSGALSRESLLQQLGVDEMPLEADMSVSHTLDYAIELPVGEYDLVPLGVEAIIYVFPSVLERPAPGETAPPIPGVPRVTIAEGQTVSLTQTRAESAAVIDALIDFEQASRAAAAAIDGEPPAEDDTPQSDPEGDPPQ